MAWSSTLVNMPAPEEGRSRTAAHRRFAGLLEELLPVDAVDHSARRVRRVRVPRRPPRVAAYSSPRTASDQTQSITLVSPHYLASFF